MATPTLLRAVGRLVVAGEQAGFTVQQMIDFLDEGMSVDGLLDLIARRLEERQRADADRAA